MESSNPTGGEFFLPVSQSFDPNTGYVIVNIAKVDYGYIDQEVLYQAKIFTPKSELHITIVSLEDAETLRKYLEQNPAEVDTVWGIIDETDWSFRKLGDLYYIQETPGVESIIQMVEIPNLESFYHSMSRLVGKGFQLPPIHVTLYVRGTERGIALPNQTAFEERLKARIDPNEIQVVSEDDQSGSEQGLLS